MNVAVCDCDKNFCAKIADILVRSAQTVGAALCVHPFTNPEDLLDAFDKPIEYLAVFLEIDLGPYNGFELGRVLKNKYKTIEIVFITQNKDYVLRGYTIPAYRYIAKNTLENKTLDCVRHLLLDKYRRQALLNLGFIGSTGIISASTIEYIEANASCTLLHTAGGQEELVIAGANMDEAENVMTFYQFVRLQKNYLVNHIYIASISPYRVVLASGTVIPIHRPSYQKIKSILACFRKQIG